MARGKQLIQLIDDLRNETGKSVRPGAGADDLPSLRYLIQRTQERLYDDYDWPHLKINPTVQLAAGQRYYDVPSELNFERLGKAYVWTNGQPLPICRGITMSNYAVYNSHVDERADPVRRWDIVWVESPSTGVPREMIEVWPIPLTSTDHLQFIGIRKLRDLISNDDVCDLDGLMIVLFCAAEILAEKKSADAQAKAALAQSRLAKVRGLTAGNTEPIIMGAGRRQLNRERITVRYNPDAGVP